MQNPGDLRTGTCDQISTSSVIADGRIGCGALVSSAHPRGIKMPYLNLTASIECVDDSGSKHYNHLVDRSVVATDWNSSEDMRNAGESYRWGIVVDHNFIVAGSTTKSPQPGGGSCIFLHSWHSQRPGHVRMRCHVTNRSGKPWLTWLDPSRKPLLVQLPERTYERLTHRWMLPKLIDVPSR